MADRTPPPADARIQGPSAKDQFKASLTSYINSSRLLTALTQAERDQLIIDIVKIAYPTTTSPQQP